MTKTMIDYTVYLVTDQFNLSEDEFLNVIEEAIKGGCSIVQLREKTSSTRDFYNLAVKVKQITSKYDVPLIINDRIDVAQAVDAEGVHLGQTDMPCNIARRILGEDKIIGITTTTYAQATEAIEQGADYLGVGTLIPTDTKKDAELITKEDLELIRDNIQIPKVGIGGIKEHNTRQIIEENNFDGVAVVSAIMLSDNPQQTSKNFYKLVKGI